MMLLTSLWVGTRQGAFLVSVLWMTELLQRSRLVPPDEGWPGAQLEGRCYVPCAIQPRTWLITQYPLLPNSVPHHTIPFPTGATERSSQGWRASPAKRPAPGAAQAGEEQLGLLEGGWSSSGPCQPSVCLQTSWEPWRNIGTQAPPHFWNLVFLTTPGFWAQLNTERGHWSLVPLT